MTSSPRTDLHDTGTRPCRRAAWALRLACAVLPLLAACSGSNKADEPLQTAARVNKAEITVHQINQMLQQQRGIKPEQLEAASQRMLEFLIDQELVVQVSRELKLDRDPRVMLQIENASREILSRAYAEKLSETFTRPGAEAVKAYYDANPALFKERRVYNVQELSIEAQPQQLPELRQRLQEAKSIENYVEQLKAGKFRFTSNQGARAAEQLPADVLQKVSPMKDGQMMLLASPTGAVVIHLVSSRLEPVDATRAQAAIEQHLLNESKRKLLDADVKARRASAKIEYLGTFAQKAASAPAGLPAPAAGAINAEDPGRGLGFKK